ncbi:MAG TPA: hypothetical protein VGB07_01215 [Blastocatellia bacterium]|jgi:hypothetical protein
MSTALQTLQEKARQLSPLQLAKIIGLMDELLTEEKPQQGRGLKFDWADGHEDDPVTESSVELQHQATEWRIESALGYLKQAPEEDECAPKSNQPSPQRHKLTFDWVDDEDADPEPLTSVELQHQATEWWVEKIEKNLTRQ